MNRAAKMAFVGSIILNVLLLGFVLGQSPRRFDRNAMRQQRMEQVIKDLPEASQQRLRERFQQLRGTARSAFRADAQGAGRGRSAARRRVLR